MDFRQILKSLYVDLKRVTLPEWGGYWYVKNGLIWVHTVDGTDCETPWFSKYCERRDWIVLPD